MEKSSVNILESLQYKIPSIRNIYNLIDINVGSSLHPENESIVSNFVKPTVIIAIGLYTGCFVIQRESKTKFHVIEIAQEVIYYKCNTGELRDKILEVLKISDFIPDPLVKKIVFIDSYNSSVRADVYYEVYKNKYSDNRHIIDSFLDFDRKELKNAFIIVNDFLKGV